MALITESQFNSLLNKQIPADLPSQLLSDLKLVNTVLLSKEQGKFSLEFMELDELSPEEIKEAKNYGDVVTLSV